MLNILAFALAVVITFAIFGGLIYAAYQVFLAVVGNATLVAKQKLSTPAAPPAPPPVVSQHKFCPHCGKPLP